jgi:FdrA protein
VIPLGKVGIVSAAGTGLQEVSTLIARNGAGITQGIGTGGRDLSEDVGGLMMLSGLKALQEDLATQVIVLISKPPAASIVRKVMQQVYQADKPAVVCFLGAAREIFQVEDQEIPHRRVYLARTLEEAAYLAAGLAISGQPRMPSLLDSSVARAHQLRSRLNPAQRYLRGLFSGGTLCYEAQVIWQELLRETVFSNAPLSKQNQLSDSNRSQGHTAIDLGEEEFTVGRLHPMIDNELRIRRLLQEANDPEVAVIMLDVVIGYGAHPDPAGELAAAIRKARLIAPESGKNLVFVASVTGTQDDPQDLGKQTRVLQEAGVEICQSNAAAARFVASLVGETS